jgi:hypothetical protein
LQNALEADIIAANCNGHEVGAGVDRQVILVPSIAAAVKFELREWITPLTRPSHALRQDVSCGRPAASLEAPGDPTTDDAIKDGRSRPTGLFYAHCIGIVRSVALILRLPEGLDPLACRKRVTESNILEVCTDGGWRPLNGGCG